ncbi:MAG: hypothetical protein N0A00_03190, partial [Candidatus Bathyarchaeota archaeon]|nr:hypothetical protein [Candidatus Bathyarchaeota archaeon]
GDRRPQGTDGHRFGRERDWAATGASASAFGPSYRGFTVQGTPSPPPKTHRQKENEATKTYKTLP